MHVAAIEVVGTTVDMAVFVNGLERSALVVNPATKM